MLNLLKRMNLPNKLTLLRIALVPALCAFICVEARWAQFAAAFIFVAAALTDMLDGKLARKNNLITDFGKLMDPVADKLLVTAAMVFLTAQRRMPAGMCVVFIAREFIISGFRMVAASRGVVIAAGPLGKYKTVAQMIAVTMAILCLPLNGLPPMVRIGGLTNILTQIVMWAALVLAVLSCVDYILRNKHIIDTTNI